MQEPKNDEPLLEQEFTVEGGDFIHAGEVSSKIKTILKEIGIRQEVIRRTAIATYEAEMNVVCYADHGKFRLAITPDRLSIVVEDKGQGIEDIDLAMKEGYSTANDRIREMGFGAGMGLVNVKNSGDRFEIQSELGQGTLVKVDFLADEDDRETC